MSKLDSLLNAEEPKKKKIQRRNPLTQLYVTQQVLDKAFTYAKLTCEISKNKGTECVGYLIAPKGVNDRIARDAFLARDQVVRAGHLRLEPEDVIKAGREIDERGYKVLGWWHSHGDLQTFHSHIDADNQMTVLNEIAPFNYIVERTEREIDDLETEIEDGKIILIDKKHPSRRYEIETDDASGLSVAKLRFTEENRIGFAYSLVVNKKVDVKKPYAEIATREYCHRCNRSRDISRVVGIKLFDDPTLVYDEEQMRDEIDEKVKFPKPIKIFKGIGKMIGFHPLDDDELTEEDLGLVGMPSYKPVPFEMLGRGQSYTTPSGTRYYRDENGELKISFPNERLPPKNEQLSLNLNRPEPKSPAKKKRKSSKKKNNKQGGKNGK